jgi:translation initiation factor IF-1
MSSNKEILDEEGRLASMVMEGIPKARFALICDQNGEILWNSQRNNVKHLLTLEETKKSLKRALDSWHTRDELASKIGKGRYAVAVYEKLARVTVPLANGHMLLVTLEDDWRMQGHIKGIMNIVEWIHSQSEKFQ